MVRRSGRLRLSAVALAAICASPALFFAREADALFRYFSRKNLAHHLATEPDKWVDTDITVTDELCYVFPSNPDTDKDRGSKATCVKFDTVYFRCAIPSDKKGDYLDKIWDEAQKGAKDIVDEIEAVNQEQRKRTKGEKECDDARKVLYSKLFTRWRTKPLVTIFGKVSRADFFTPDFYFEDAKRKPDDEAKARPEPITILLERVEKPRDRYLDYGCDDED